MTPPECRVWSPPAWQRPTGSRSWRCHSGRTHWSAGRSATSRRTAIGRGSGSAAPGPPPRLAEWSPEYPRQPRSTSRSRHGLRHGRHHRYPSEAEAALPGGTASWTVGGTSDRRRPHVGAQLTPCVVSGVKLAYNRRPSMRRTAAPLAGPGWRIQMLDLIQRANPGTSRRCCQLLSILSSAM
jgi:hypothetical protein